MELDFSKFNEFIESYAKPRWEDQNEEWPLRIGGGEVYIQDKVLKKAASFLTEEALQSNPLENVSNALKSHHNLLNQYDLMYAKVFLDQVNENDLRKHLIAFIHGTEDWEIRLKKFYDWSKVTTVPGEKIKTGFSARVTSYLLSMHNPRLYPFCKPTAYNTAVESLLSKKELKKDRVERIIHCKSIYTEVLKLLEKEYGLVNGNLLDVHSLFHIFSTTNKKMEPLTKVTKGKNYWWLTANPKIWSFDELPVNDKQIYTSINDKGNKRRIYENFTKVQSGDLIVGYIATPVKEVVGLCRSTSTLFDTSEGEGFEFEKIENFSETLSLDEIKAAPILKDSEPILNNCQGSLFRLTEEEFDAIRALIDEKLAYIEGDEVIPYSLRMKNFMKFWILSSIKKILSFKVLPELVKPF